MSYSAVGLSGLVNTFGLFLQDLQSTGAQIQLQLRAVRLLLSLDQIVGMYPFLELIYVTSLGR